MAALHPLRPSPHNSWGSRQFVDTFPAQALDQLTHTAPSGTLRDKQKGERVSATSNLITFVLIAAGGAAALALVKAKLAPGGTEAKFKARPLLTANEMEFLSRLEGAAPELRFCPQVAMGA